MNNKDIIKKLVNITANQQKILTKLAQMQDPATLYNFIKSNTSTWLANNGFDARYNFKFEESSDPNYDYNLTVKMAPAPNKTLEQDLPAKYKEYIAAKMLENPALKSKSVNINVQILPNL